MLSEVSIYFKFIELPNFKNGEYDVKCECDEWFTILQDAALLLSNAGYQASRGRVAIRKQYLAFKTSSLSLSFWSDNLSVILLFNFVFSSSLRPMNTSKVK